MSASCDKPHHVGLGPMRHLVEHLRWGCTDQAQQVWLLDAVFAEHAHELAEKIRNSPPELLAALRKRYGYGSPDVDHVWSAAIFLADLIDPGVSDG
jgi:hypothetical protein